jgi:hypothetical protein
MAGDAEAVLLDPAEWIWVREKSCTMTSSYVGATTALTR